MHLCFKATGALGEDMIDIKDFFNHKETVIKGLFCKRLFGLRKILAIHASLFYPKQQL